jgi:hypothetical protein
MKKILLPFLLLLIINNAHAQSRHFNKLYCDTVTRLVSPIYHDFESTSDDYIYITTGYENITNTDAQISKYDKNFNLIWKKTYGGSNVDYFYRIREISNHRLLAWGCSKSIDGDVLNNYPTGLNAWACILDTNGNILHQVIISQNESSTDFRWIKEGADGNFYYGGSATSTMRDFVDNAPFNFADNGYLGCFDSQLNKKWIHFFISSNYGENSFINNVEVLPNGHLMMLANSHPTTNANSIYNVSTPTAKGYTVLMEIDTLFNVYWRKRYGTSNPPFNYPSDGHMGEIFKDDNKDEYYLVGETSAKNGDCWDSYPYLSKGDHRYTWVMKVDTLGNKIWSHIYGQFSEDGTDGINAGGYYFDKNKLTFYYSVKGGDNYYCGDTIGKADTWVYTIDSLGNIIDNWRHGYDGLIWTPQKVVKNKTTGIEYFLHYQFKDTVVKYKSSYFQCDTSINVMNRIVGTYEVWPASINAVSRNDMTLKVYPNPAQNELIVDEMKKGTQLEIYTLDGKKIWYQKAMDTKEIINVSQWQRGNYILKAIYKKQQYSQKITIQ